MKKNPIDELFAQKLAEHRQEPSQRALERFKERLQEKESKKRGAFFTINRNVWYYGAAASIAIALTIGILSKNNEPKHNLAKNQAKTNEIKEKLNNNDTQIAQVLPKINDKKVIQFSRKSTQLKHKLAPKQLFEAPETPIEVAKFNENLIPTDVLNEPLKEEKVAMTVEETQPILPKIEALSSKTIEQNSDKKDMVLVISELPISQEQDVVLAKNDSGNEFSSENEEEVQTPNEPFLKRFWTQLKHLQKGEKVDLKMLRIKPKEVLARANDAFFKEDRQDAQESWGRLRNRLSKNNN